MEAIVRERDSRAFDRLYDRHTGALYGLALRVTGDPALAEDIVHDAWIQAVERLATFRWEAALRTWLCAFVLNGARGRLRRLAREVPLAEGVEPRGTDQRLRGVFDRVDLERALAALAPGFRQVLLLHDVEGYTHEEIAELLDVAPGTSKSQLARARASLRRALGVGESYA